MKKQRLGILFATIPLTKDSYLEYIDLSKLNQLKQIIQLEYTTTNMNRHFTEDYIQGQISTSLGKW